MAVNVGIVATGPSVSLTLDYESLTTRVAALLRRPDLNSEIGIWLNFALRQLTHQVNFPELRATTTISLSSMPIAPVSDPETYFLYALPADYDHEDRFYYRNTTDPNNIWGHNMIPLPRSFYAGDTVDYERLLNTTVPSVGDPRKYFIDYNNLGIWPALTDGLTGEIEVTYYKLVSDMVYPNDEPDIDNKYRHYLVWLAYYWGMVLLEKEDPVKVLAAERKFYKTINEVRSLVNRRENKSLVIAWPDSGLEEADEIF